MNLRDLFLCKNFGPQASGDGGSGVVINNQNRTFTENGVYNADAGYTGLGTVTVDVPEKEPVVEPLVVTENGEYTPGSGVDGFSPVTVNVEASGGGGYSIEDIARTDVISGDITLDNVTARSYAFYGLTGVKKVTIGENVEPAYANALANGYLFASSSAEEVEIFRRSDEVFPHNGYWGHFFNNCKSLKNAVGLNFIPQNYFFTGCTALEWVDILRIHGGNSYNGCNNMKVIIMRRPTLQALSTNNSAWDFSLNETPFDPDWANATGGFCLVPSALVSEYQAATNWSVLYEAGTCTFLPLEEYTVDGTTTGEIDWDKLNAVVYPEEEKTA